jgi:hypothetical protein
MPFRGYDEDLKLYRRYANQGFNKNAAVKYHAGQTRDVHVFLQRLVTNSGNFVQEFNMSVLILYGCVSTAEFSI